MKAAVKRGLMSSNSDIAYDWIYLFLFDATNLAYYRPLVCVMHHLLRGRWSQMSLSTNFQSCLSQNVKGVAASGCYSEHHAQHPRVPTF
jgi:hypothetical protein